MLRRAGALAILGWAAVMAAGLPASGAPITSTPQSATIPATETDWGPTNFPDTVNPLNFTKFDPKLGTLEAVNLSLSYTFKQTVSMTFTDPSTITLDESQSSIAVQRPNGTTILNQIVPADMVSQTYTGPTFPHMITLPPNTQDGSITPLTLTTPADLALFTQSGPADTVIKLPVFTTAQSSVMSSSGNGRGGDTDTIGVVASISYTYAPIPEPSSFAALALGLGGYLLARRQRRSRAAG